MNHPESEKVKGQTHKGWIVLVVVVLMLFLGGWLGREYIFVPSSPTSESQNSSKSKEPAIVPKSFDNLPRPAETSETNKPSEPISSEDFTTAAESGASSLAPPILNPGMNYNSGGIRLAVIDLSKVFDGYYLTKEEQAHLKQRQKAAQTEIDAAHDQKDSAYWQQRKTFLEKEISDQLLKSHKKIVKQIQAEIAIYSGQHDFDLVFDISGDSISSGAPFLVYVSSAIPNITQDILAQVNDGHETK